MKTSLTKISLLSLTLLLSVVVVGCGGKNQQKNSNVYNPSHEEVEKFEDHAKEEHGEGHEYVNAEQLAKYDSSELSEQEAADIIHMRQEEKLARDVYRTLGETYSINQFRNIPMSEQKHTDAMELLLERYDIEDPIKDETQIGTYKDEKFVELYTQLTEKGKESLTDALLAGATIEDLNMAKLLEVIKNTDNEDIKFVYESVLEQSYHHMNAFIRGLDKQGKTYTPEHITQAYFDSVISGETPKVETYMPPSIEEFYSDIEEMWLKEEPEAKELSLTSRDEILKGVLMSHESHLDGFTTQEMQDKAYTIVTQQVIEASK